MALEAWLGSLSAPALAALVFLLGLLVGSFLNVVILRLPRRLEFGWRQQCSELLEQGELALEAPPDLVRFPSHCRQCSHRLAWYENIPLVSWLVLRGRCSSCGDRISIQYPAVELATALLSATVVLLLGTPGDAAPATTLAALAFTWALIALTMIDLREQLLPDVITLPLLWGGLLVNAAGIGFTDLHSAVWGAAAGYGVLWFVYHGFRLLTGKEGMGYGDFKLLGAIGAWLGWQLLPLVVILSSFVGAVVGIGMIVIRGRDRNVPMPFGPYLATAGWIAFIWGADLVEGYLRASGLA